MQMDATVKMVNRVRTVSKEKKEPMVKMGNQGKMVVMAPQAKTAKV